MRVGHHSFTALQFPTARVEFLLVDTPLRSDAAGRSVRRPVCHDRITLGENWYPRPSGNFSGHCRAHPLEPTATPSYSWDFASTNFS
ncbi:hypothetical protein C8039_18625 [Halogeometricum sp. wsp3]|nr:hypothetical protein C8039_18625 [Halogeometricum sp. wsp3]